MLRKTKVKIQLKFSLIFLLILISSIGFGNFSSKSYFLTISEDKSDDSIDENDFENENIQNLKSSILGNDTWWDIDFLYRRLIVITNDNDVGLENYPVKIEFNYSSLVYDKKMNASCKDIRIVENGVLRKYYFQIDYPISEIVTVWFETTIEKGPGKVEYDTYLYYGNMAADIEINYFMNESSDNPSDAFGWIRNGDFEWEDYAGSKLDLFDFFGWHYSDNPPSDIDVGDGVQSVGSNEHGLLHDDDDQYQERVFQGNYSFKWGDIDNYVDSTTIEGTGQDYEGRIYSYPFIIPTLTGADAGDKIYLTFYINVRSYTSQPQSVNGFVLRISSISNYGETGSAAGTYKIYHNYGTKNKQATATLLNLLEGSGPSPAETRDQSETGPPFSNDGDLTGQFINFDVTDWQGECIFFEACTYGPETGKKRSVFAQLDDIKFNFQLDINLEDDEQKVQTEITVITKDVDGRIVPNANVSLVDTTKANPILRSKVTDSGGSTCFSNVGYGTYNFTVEYTLENSGKKGIVFDSTKPGEANYTFDESQSIYEVILILNMSTIDFEFVDWAGRPMNYGFVNVKTSKNGESLENITLDTTGKATFRWFNASSYYYEVYYENIDYADSPIKMNESYIYRSNYVKDNEKFQTQIFNVDDINIGTGSEFEVHQYIYTNGSSTELGNKKIINFTLTLENMDDYLENVTIYYIDKTNSTEGNLIVSKTDYTSSDNSDTIEVIIRDPPEDCSNLLDDKYEAYGLLIIVKGVNITGICTGIITVDLVETWNVYNKTALARVNIQVVNQGTPIDVAKVFVTTGPPGTNSIVNLSSYVDKGPDLLDSDGWVYGRINYLIPFWYFIGWSYNISISISGQPTQFKINKTLTGEWEAKGLDLVNYNFTLSYDNGTIILDTSVVPAQIQTKFTNNIITEEVIWGDIIEVSVYYEFTTDGSTWNPMPNTGNVYIKFKSVGVGGKVYITTKMNYALLGTLTYTLNSNILSAGIDAQSYIVTIFADEDEYVNPNELVNYTVVIAKETDMDLLGGYPDFELISEYSQYFGELINISIRYYDNDTKSSITEANVYYDWLNLGNIQFYEDPENNSYYTVELNTSLARYVGVQIIKITAYKENYTIQQNVLISLRILDRPTSLNEKTDLVYISKKIWVENTEFLNFSYKDITFGANIIVGDLDVATYTWQELDEDGDPVTGNDGTGILTQNPDNIYTLDFNTGIRPVGYYFLAVSMKKDNYELRGSYINLEIKLREFDSDLGATNLEDDQVTIVKGKDIEFEIELLDTTRGNIPLIGAKVVLEIGDKEYEFDEDDPGVYTYTFSTDEIEAFFTSKTYTGQIIIEAVNFTSEEIDVTIVVTMEEVFPGMPTFYFIMLIASIAATVGSLASYRIIQQARIPKHVKKILLVKKKIKARDSIPKNLSIPTKEQMILKEFGTAWKDLDLSLEDILGIKAKKSRIKSDENTPLKQIGGGK